MSLWSLTSALLTGKSDLLTLRVPEGTPRRRSHPSWNAFTS
jgi:hypothetical protein